VTAGTLIGPYEIVALIGAAGWAPIPSAGSGFLVNTPVDDGGSRSIQVVLNWTAGLKRR
jgi:hypothetical protein